MFAPSRTLPLLADWRPSSAVLTVATVAAKFAALATFAVAGTVFFGLAIASPIALPIAQRSLVSVSAADVAAAQQLGSIWWLFAIGAVLSFAAALITIGRLLEHLGTEARAQV